MSALPRCGSSGVPRRSALFPLLLAAALTLPLLVAPAGAAEGQERKTEAESHATSASPGSPPGRSGTTFVPNEEPTLRVAPARGEIQVDGRLDDPGWVDAARVTGFSEVFPDEKARPPVRTEALVTYDQEHLYVAFLARDDPASVRASLRDRDEIFSDDFVGVMIDTYADQSWAYELFANPLGIQGDLRLTTSSGEDGGFDVVYHTEGRVSSDEYTVEMAIPFASLRFPDRDEQTWRVNFFRVHPRGSRAQYSWAAIDRDDPCFMCQWGTLTGIRGVSPGGSLELMPAVVGAQAGAMEETDAGDLEFRNGDPSAELSLDGRYAFASGITAEMTLNPDFSQVESDAGQIDANTTFALFFPERRPFFQEGSDLFDSRIDAIYTRSLNDPQAAVKLTARSGQTSVAYLGARDEHSPLLVPFEDETFVGLAGKSVSNIVRGRRALGESSYVGFLATDRRFEDTGGSGTTFGADGLTRVGDNYQVEWQVLGSHTDEPDRPELTEGVNESTFDGGEHTAAFDGESFWGHAAYLSFERSARVWSFDLDYWSYSPTFRADNGFQRRNDRRELFLWQDVDLYPSSGWIDRVGAFTRAGRIWNFRGVPKEDLLVVGINGQFTGQSFVSLEYWRDPERFAGIDFDDGWGWNLYAESSFSDPVRLGVNVGGGDDIARNLDPPILADQRRFRVWGTFKPTQRLVVQPEARFLELTSQTDGSTILSGYIFRTRSSLQFTRELFLRLVVQYDEFDHDLAVEPLLTYKINPFTLFFVGSSHGYHDFGPTSGLGEGFHRDEQQFFAKFQYLLRL